MGQYFRLHGLTGYLIAVALLLSILAFLTVNAIAVQQTTASNYYKLENPLGIKTYNNDNASVRAAHLKSVKVVGE